MAKPWIPALMMLTLWESVRVSAKVASYATVLVIATGTPVAWLLARRRLPGQLIIESLLLLPMTLPPVAVGLCLLYLMSPDGLVGSLWQSLTGDRLLLTWQAAAVAAFVMSLPLYVRGAQEAFAAVPHRLVQMAQTLGLSPWRLWWQVTFPLAARGLAAAALLAFARAIGEFGATTMVAGAIAGQTQTLAVGIYASVTNGDDRLAILMAVASGVIAILATLGNRWLSMRMARSPEVWP